MRVAAPLVLAAAVAAIASGCGTTGVASGGADEARGKALFVQSCGSCHRLADAGTTGTIGPDLDAAFRQARSEGFEESTVRAVVRGQIAYPVVDPVGVIEVDGEERRAPGMPANLVEGEDADAVAAYVASVAGLDEKESGLGGETSATTTTAVPPPPATTEETEAETETTAGGEEGTFDADQVAAGKSVFAKAGCGSCHTLADAGSSGTVGPNLDESSPSTDKTLDRVTNGKGAMPPFKGQLTEAEIEAVAVYVAAATGGDPAG